METYEHTQKAPMHYLLWLVAAGMLVGAWQARATPPVAVLLVVVAAVMLVLAASFQSLTVRDEGDHLAIRFGPLPLFFRRIPYTSVSKVERSRSSVIDGWGIHYLFGRGTTFNLWGFDCAKLRVDNRVVRIGTDDADNLVSFLTVKIQSISRQSP